MPQNTNIAVFEEKKSAEFLKACGKGIELTKMAAKCSKGGWVEVKGSVTKWSD